MFAKSVSSNLSKHVSRNNSSSQEALSRKHSNSPEDKLGIENVGQTKLLIGKSGDKFEREADRMSNLIVNSPSRNTSSRQVINKSEENENELQTQEEEKEPLAKAEIQKQEKSQTKLQLQQDSIQLKREIPSKKKKGGIKFIVNVNEPKGEAKEEIQAKTTGSVDASNVSHASFEDTLNSSKSGGAPLPETTRTYMESNFNSDFSGVRIHTDSTAAQMSSQIGAQAFTHGSNIYFNEGKYDPSTSEGKTLLAHELTHTIQQGASIQKATKANIQKKSHTSVAVPVVQRSWLGDAWDAVSDVASSAVELVSEGLEAGLNFIKDKFHDFVRGIPGYSLLAVVLGQDPISGEPVARNGRNFIEAGLDIIPFGNLFKQKLEQTGALEEAAGWLDSQIAGLDISLSAIKAEVSAFWDSLSLSDIGNPGGVLERAANIIRRPIGQIVTFAGNVATEFLRIVKNYVLTELAEFVKNNTRGYPLLTVILGKDPITDEPVERSGMNLIKGFMLLSADGEEQLRQMEESGSLQRAADWIDTTVAELDLSWETIKNLFSQAWDLISIENLMTPIDTFMKIVSLFAEPVGRIIRFIVKVSLKILEFIKDALLRRLSAFAHETRGFHLITVLLGKDPFTGERVERTPENIIRGFMSLKEGGEEQFQQMKETGAIARTLSRIDAAIEKLGFTWEYITGLFKTAWESFSLQDLAAPLEAFARIVNLFADPIKRLFAFVWEILKIVIEVLLAIMNFPVDIIGNIITKAMQAIEDIKRDPIGFLKNILKAIKQGFVQFFDNILQHLLFGVTGWLFGELKDAGINPPKDFTFKSILGFVLEVLGISMDRIWKKLAEKIGQDKVDKIKGMLDKLEGIWAFVRDVVTRGPIAIWEYIVEQLSNLWDIVLDSVKNWVMTKIIEQIVTKLLSMLDPTGIMAVVNSVIAIYKAIQSFIRYLREMLEIINSFVEGVAEIARGNIKIAADFIENAMHRSMPVIIGFLANQVGLGGVGKKIGEMIEKVREKVDNALGWLIDKAVKAGTAFLNMLKSGAASVKEGIAGLFEWWKGKKSFTTKDKKNHEVYFKGNDKNAKMYVHSEEENEVEKFLNEYTGPGEIGKAKEAYTEMRAKIAEMNNIYQSRTPPEEQQKKINDLKPLIEGSRDKLVAALGTMEIDSQIKLGKSFLQFGGDSETNKFAIGAPITQIPGNTIGSPTGGAQILKQEALERSARGVSRSVVQGHLISHQLHGPAEPRNLVMIPGSMNKGDMQALENDAKAKLNQGKPFYYGVKARMHPKSSVEGEEKDYFFAKQMYKIPITDVTTANARWDEASEKWTVTDNLESQFTAFGSEMKPPRPIDEDEIKRIIATLKTQLDSALNNDQKNDAIKTAVAALKGIGLSRETMSSLFKSQSIDNPTGEQWTYNSSVFKRTPAS